MVEISKSGSGEGLGGVIPWGYSTISSGRAPRRRPFLGGVQASRAFSENRTVMSPRLLRPRSYSRQLVTRYSSCICGSLGWTCARPGVHLLDIQCIEKLSRSGYRSQERFVHQRLEENVFPHPTHRYRRRFPDLVV